LLPLLLLLPTKEFPSDINKTRYLICSDYWALLSIEIGCFFTILKKKLVFKKKIEILFHFLSLFGAKNKMKLTLNNY